jgi:hypothetical protein
MAKQLTLLAVAAGLLLASPVWADSLTRSGTGQTHSSSGGVHGSAGRKERNKREGQRAAHDRRGREVRLDPHRVCLTGCDTARD